MINNAEIMKKMERALKISGNLYRMEDILMEMEKGNLQGHVEGDTWAVTQVHIYPNRKAVNVLFAVGSLENSLKLEPKVEAWAKEQGATLLTATGRGGWWQHRTPGWRVVGTMYAKDI